MLLNKIKNCELLYKYNKNKNKNTFYFFIFFT